MTATLVFLAAAFFLTALAASTAHTASYQKWNGSTVGPIWDNDNDTHAYRGENLWDKADLANSPGPELVWQPLPELDGTVTFPQAVYNGNLWGAVYRSVYYYDDDQQKTEGGVIPDNRQYLTKPFFTSSGVFLHTLSKGDRGARLLRSLDGVSDFVEVHHFGNNTQRTNSLHRSLVDAGNGRLFYFEYDDLSRVFASQDGGQNWSLLIEPTTNAVRHFHGAIYDPVYDKLYAMTGDNNLASSILVCDDLDSLLSNPDQWASRWGLLDAGRTTLDIDYAINVDGKTQGQETRSVDLYLSGEYAYWGEDASHVGGQRLFRTHRDTNVVEQVGDGTVIGQVWNWTGSKNGTILVATGSGWTNGRISPGSDEYIHLYALTKGGTDFIELARYERKDADAPSGSGMPFGLVEHKGTTWLWSYKLDTTYASKVEILVPEPSGLLLLVLAVGCLAATRGRSYHS